MGARNPKESKEPWWVVRAPDRSVPEVLRAESISAARMEHLSDKPDADIERIEGPFARKPIPLPEA